MTREEITLLESEVLRCSIEENIGRDPLTIALDKRVAYAPLVSSQVKYLQRAKLKLPAYYEARCIIPGRAFEQSSSEEASGNKLYSGSLCIDLTGGLGVDSVQFSKHFTRVIMVERDPILAHIAVINFDRLGIGNIEVKNMAAEDFLRDFAGGRADLIYVDPDRRSSDGRKLVRFEDCEPDVISILYELKAAAQTVLIKASPLFDIDEAIRIFGPGVRVEAVSLAGECKEILIEIGNHLSAPIVKATIIGKGEVEYAHGTVMKVENKFMPPYKFMVVPDVALRKARISSQYFTHHIPDAYISPGEGYVFFSSTVDNPQKIPGRIFEVITIERYDPKRLKAELKGRGIKGIDIYLHAFPESVAAIAKRLSVKEGGAVKLAFTAIEGSLWVIELK